MSAPHTALVQSETGLAHDTGPGHPERPERLPAILDAFEREGIDGPWLPVEAATREDLLRAHSEDHIDLVAKACKGETRYPDADTVMMEASWDAALHAAGGAIAACKAVLNGDAKNVFCITRPPGHHAERHRAMGFCLFNTAAIAARWLQQVRNVDRIAILDWDVHHGNGTQDITYDDPGIYYASIHQHPHYPGTGFPGERGAENTNLNIQMAPGADPEDWLDALADQILPEFERFQPGFLLISCGFDAHQADPLGAQRLSAGTFAEMTRQVRGLANGRVVSQLEGGYNLGALADCALAHYQALKGE